MVQYTFQAPTYSLSVPDICTICPSQNLRTYHYQELVVLREYAYLKCHIEITLF